jgi:imidazolonepropionase-like amidohydrolase
VKAGLTPQQALVTSVINGPKFFELEDYYGSVDIGKVADLILLDKNPLDKIENISKINALVKKGKIYEKETINKMILKLKEE